MSPHPNPLPQGERGPAAAPLLVTGATGFVGRHLCRRLLERGRAVRALARDPAKARDLAALGAEIVRSDVTDPASLEKAVSGVSAVLHLAGAADVADAAVNEAVNVGGVRNLADAMKRAGVRRIVHFSSHCAGRRLRDAYGESKLRGEEVLKAAGLDATILRPTMIVGEGSKEWATFVRVIRFFPVVPIVGTGKTRLRPVLLEDALDAAEAALARPETAGKVYEIAGPEPVAVDDLVRLVARSLGARQGIVHLPAGPVLAAVRLLGRLTAHPPVVPDQAMAFLQDTEADIEPARRDLGFAPRALSERNLNA